MQTSCISHSGSHVSEQVSLLLMAPEYSKWWNQKMLAVGKTCTENLETCVTLHKFFSVCVPHSVSTGKAGETTPSTAAAAGRTEIFSGVMQCMFRAQDLSSPGNPTCDSFVACLLGHPFLEGESGSGPKNAPGPAPPSVRGRTVAADASCPPAFPGLLSGQLL